MIHSDFNYFNFRVSINRDLPQRRCSATGSQAPRLANGEVYYIQLRPPLVKRWNDKVEVHLRFHMRFLRETWGFRRKRMRRAERREKDRRQPASWAGWGQLTGGGFFFLSPVLLDEWNTFSYKNDSKWITLYNEQVEYFFFLFWGDFKISTLKG